MRIIVKELPMKEMLKLEIEVLKKESLEIQEIWFDKTLFKVVNLLSIGLSTYNKKQQIPADIINSTSSFHQKM